MSLQPPTELAVASAAPAIAQTDLLDPVNFATRFARGERRNAEVQRCHALLCRLQPEMPALTFAEWLDDLAHWLRSRRPLPEQRPDESPQAAHLRTLFEAMELLPTQLAWLRAGVALLFSSSRAVTLFTDVGVPSRQGFFSETVDRISRMVLPDPPVEGDLGEVLTRLFKSGRAVEWFEALTAEEASRLFALLAVPGGRGLDPLRRDMTEAALLIALRVTHHGLANDIRQRAAAGMVTESAFYRLTEAVQDAVAIDGTGALVDPGAADRCRELIAACRRQTREIEAALERTGVSVDLVYRLDLIRRKLDRLYALLSLLAPQGGTAPEGAGLRLLLTLVRGSRRDRSVNDLFRSSTRLLARRVVEAAALSGEHYATRSSNELHRLYGSAAGGGLVTSFTALLKFLFGWAGLAPFWEGFFFSVNYAASFVTMQLLGFTLASKQPSVTAAHLARAIDERQGASLEPLAHEVARVFRSQLAATLGNLGAVIPAAVGIHLLLVWLTGRGLLTPEYASAVVSAHHPFSTAVVPGAMVTGIALWISSLSAGALENWAVYRRLPEAIASQRSLRAVLGPDRARRLGAVLLRSIGALGGNLTLGFQMGMVPTLAAFFGVPLQLPHVAVATGQLAFAGAALGPERVVYPGFGFACLGILFIGLMNFGVSFALALWVALRARESGILEVLAVARSVGKLFLARPADFFRAPPEARAG